jgi:hypothetical protein
VGTLLSWLVLGTLSGATSLVLLLDYFEARNEPDPIAQSGFGVQVTIAVVSAWIFAFAVYRVVTYLRGRDLA